MNIENLKIKFPNYKITDASNRTPEQIIRICKICDTVSNLMIFIERNAKNEDYFEVIENVENVRIGSFKYIILTEQSFFVNERDDYSSYILHLQRMLNNNTDCSICFEEKLKRYTYCNQCACACCMNCFDKLGEKNKPICPICRCESFEGMDII
jgi:hypothetical protein